MTAPGRNVSNAVLCRRQTWFWGLTPGTPEVTADAGGTSHQGLVQAHSHCSQCVRRIILRMTNFTRTVCLFTDIQMLFGRANDYCSRGVIGWNRNLFFYKGCRSFSAEDFMAGGRGCSNWVRGRGDIPEHFLYSAHLQLAPVVLSCYLEDSHFSSRSLFCPFPSAGKLAVATATWLPFSTSLVMGLAGRAWPQLLLELSSCTKMC